MKKNLLSENSFLRKNFPEKLIKTVSAPLYKGREERVFSRNSGIE